MDSNPFLNLDSSEQKKNETAVLQFDPFANVGLFDNTDPFGKASSDQRGDYISDIFSMFEEPSPQPKIPPKVKPNQTPEKKGLRLELDHDIWLRGSSAPSSEELGVHNTENAFPMYSKSLPLSCDTLDDPFSNVGNITDDIFNDNFMSVSQDGIFASSELNSNALPMHKTMLKSSASAISPRASDKAKKMLSHTHHGRSQSTQVSPSKEDTDEDVISIRVKSDKDISSFEMHKSDKVWKLAVELAHEKDMLPSKMELIHNKQQLSLWNSFGKQVKNKRHLFLYCNEITATQDFFSQRQYNTIDNKALSMFLDIHVMESLSNDSPLIAEKEVEIVRDATLLDLKFVYEAKFDVPIEHQRFFFKKKELLQLDQMLCYLSIMDSSVLELLIT